MESSVLDLKTRHAQLLAAVRSARSQKKTRSAFLAEVQSEITALQEGDGSSTVTQESAERLTEQAQRLADEQAELTAVVARQRSEVEIKKLEIASRAKHLISGARRRVDELRRMREPFIRGDMAGEDLAAENARLRDECLQMMEHMQQEKEAMYEYIGILKDRILTSQIQLRGATGRLEQTLAELQNLRQEDAPLTTGRT